MDTTDILYHLGEGDISHDLPGSPPIFQTSNFLFKNVADMQRALEKENEIPFYTRGSNPTVKVLEKKLASLEGMTDALAFSSGSAAISATVLSQLQSGDHVLCVSKPYSWTNKLLNVFLPRFGVSSTFHDAVDTDAFIQEIKPNTKVIYLESPNSWTFEMQDIEAITAIARARGIITILDNSYASPLFQQPGQHGVDLVVHSATKFIGGHSDVVAGVACGSKSLIEKIFKSEYMTLGGIISPFDAWLLIRSLRTLPLRMKHIGESTEKVVDALAGHPKIKKLYYPQAQTYDQPKLAQKYLKGSGGMFTIDLATTDPGKIESFCDHLKYFKLACSWGSFESLVFPAITTISSLNYDNPNIVINRVRLSVGLDEPDHLIRDILVALDTI